MLRAGAHYFPDFGAVVGAMHLDIEILQGEISLLYGFNRPHPGDPAMVYIGAGANANRIDAEVDPPLGTVDFDDGTGVHYILGGSYEFNPGMRMFLEARYFDFETDATATGALVARNPQIFTGWSAFAGVEFGF